MEINGNQQGGDGILSEIKENQQTHRTIKHTYWKISKNQANEKGNQTNALDFKSVPPAALDRRVE